MYLYKATCPEIPTPKQKGGQKHGGERGQQRGSKQTPGGKIYPPLVCWGGLHNNSQLELKHLEEFLNVHTLSLQDSVRARTGMAYRYRTQRGRDVYAYPKSIRCVFGVSFGNCGAWVDCCWWWRMREHSFSFKVMSYNMTARAVSKETVKKLNFCSNLLTLLSFQTYVFC